MCTRFSVCLECSWVSYTTRHPHTAPSVLVIGFQMMSLYEDYFSPPKSVPHLSVIWLLVVYEYIFICMFNTSMPGLLTAQTEDSVYVVHYI